MAEADPRPSPLRAIRHDGWTPQRQRDFIEALALTGSVATAARRAGMSATSAYRFRLRAEGKAFADAWRAAVGHAHQVLEESAMDRAINGTSNPVYYKGEVVGERTTTHEKLIMFMLQRHGGRDRAVFEYEWGQPKHLKQLPFPDWTTALAKAVDALPQPETTPVTLTPS